MSKYTAGTILCTKDGQAYTNAIIIGESKEANFIVLTDFGNVRIIPVNDISDYYEVSKNQIEYDGYGYPFPSIEERIKEQIGLLNDALITLNKLNCQTDKN